jgi:Sec-independent protein translocase protein TatA
MFGIGLPELILIMAIALVVVGPEQLPVLAKTLARQVLELKQAATALQESLRAEDTADPRGPHDSGPGQVVEQLVSQSPHALPGDQWFHEQGAGVSAIKPVETPPVPSNVAISEVVH